MIQQKMTDIDSFLGFDSIEFFEPLSLEEQQNNLKNAQNVNRRRPRKGEIREDLRQINVSCPTYIREQFTEISLLTGKTKRTLLEEAIKHLVKKYAR